MTLNELKHTLAKTYEFTARKRLKAQIAEAEKAEKSKKVTEQQVNLFQ